MAVGMKNVTADLGNYELEEIGQEFMSTASATEKEYILSKTVVGTKVYLLLGVKNTHVQPLLIRVLSSGVGVYLSPFKDLGGSRINFAGPSKVFTGANKDQQRESNHAVYVLCNPDMSGESVNYKIDGEVRFDSNSKMKTSPLLESSRENIGPSCRDDNLILSNYNLVISSIISTEPARLQAKVNFALKIKNIDQAEFRIRKVSENKIDKSPNLKVLTTEFKFKGGLRTKIDKSLDLKFLKIFFELTMLGAEEFRTTIESRWEALRSKPFNPEQM